MKWLLLLTILFSAFPVAFSSGINFEGISFSQVCSQMNAMIPFENMTINLQDINLTDLVRQIGIERIREFSDEPEFENMTEEELLYYIEQGYLPEEEITEEIRNSFIDNPIFTLFSIINKTTTMDIYYNKTNCITVTVVMENGEPRNVTFGRVSSAPLYIKLDMLFVEEMAQTIQGGINLEGFSAIMFYFQMAQRVLGAMFRGDIVISPIWGIFDLFSAFTSFMGAQ